MKRLALIFFVLFSFINSQLISAGGATLTSPAGTVPGWGVAFAGLGGLATAPSSDRVDGAFALGMGLGDPNESVGGSVSLGIGSINPFDGGMGERGYFSFTIGQTIAETKTSWAFGINNLFGWYILTKKADTNYSFAISQPLPFSSKKFPLTVNFGVGNGSYANKNSPALSDIGIFASIGVELSPSMSIILDHTGVATSFGAATMPLPGVPVAVNFVAWDVFGQVANHNKPSFMGVLAYVYQFKG